MGSESLPPELLLPNTNGKERWLTSPKRALPLSSRTSRMVSSSLTESLSPSPSPTMDPSRSSSELNTRKLSTTPPRMSSSSSTLPGAVTARLLPPNGKSSVSTSRDLTLSSPSSMPPPTRSTELKLRDTPPSSSTPLTTRLDRTTPKDVKSRTSRNGSPRTPRLTRLTSPPKVPPLTRRRLSSDYSSTRSNL